MRYLIFCTLILLSYQKTCRTLVLSGGGNKGAYQSGALHTFSQILPKEEIEYDYISGISAGALNALFMSFFAKGDEAKMAEELMNFWETTNTSDIYTNWDSLLWGLVDGMFKERGLFNNQPLIDYITGIYNSFGSRLRRKITVGTVDSQNAKFYTYNEDISPQQDIILATVSSASIPLFFPFRTFRGHQFLDGSTLWNTNLASGIKRCYNDVDKEEDIIVDIITLTNIQLKTEKKAGDTISNLIRYRDIKGYYDELQNIFQVMQQYPKCQYRYLLVPTGWMTDGINQMYFNNQTVFPMIQLGMQDAKTAIDAGPGYNFDQLKVWYNNQSAQPFF